MSGLIKCVVAFLFSISSFSIDTSITNESVITEKIISDAKITDSFSEDRVLIVLNEVASSKSKVYDKNDFYLHRCVAVKDLTSYKNENNTSGNFNRVLSLELANSSKEYVLETISELIKRDDVLYAGPDYEISINSTTPNDYDTNTQWAINNLKLPQAWDISTGSNEVVVGVIDSGIDGTHPDLQGSIVNSLCRDFTSGEEVVVSNPVDPNGHGTHVAGIIGAIGNNGLGVTGTNWEVSLVSLRVFNFQGRGYISNVVKAIDFAEKNGIKVLNLSGAWYENQERYDDVIDTIIDDYYGLIVCAAGNESIDIDGSIQAFPASYECDNIISVGAHNLYNDKIEISNYGQYSVDIYAPGSEVYSTLPGGVYGEKNGTSMATPYVTGVVALLLSINENLTVAQLKNAILNSAETITINIYDQDGPILDGYNYTQTVKKLNAYNAVKYVLNNYSSSTTLKYNTKSLSGSVDSTSTFFNEKNYFLKMNVQNAYEYDFTISSSSALDVTLYDSNFNEINVSQTSTNGGLIKTFSYFLSVGTYYLQSNYVSSTVSGTINVSIAGEPHTHSYTVQYYNNRYHKMTCVCGQTTNWQEAHAVLQSEIESGRYATCLSCNHRLDLNFDEAIVLGFNSSSVTRVTINGSYILPSGIIVLVDEDLNAYLNGTLLFYDKDKVPVIQ